MAFGVGSFGQVARTIIHRQPTNPMDKSTIISIIPKIITEWKPTLFPGKFVIPAAIPGDYELFVVEPSSWFLPNINDRIPPTEVPVNSAELAKSIVLDYCNGVHLCDMNERMPGLFWIPGEWTKKNISTYMSEGGKSFDVMLNEARRKQRNWYMALVQDVDMLWARSNGNPKVIDENAVIAARDLQLTDKPWMQDLVSIAKINCKFCGTLVDPKFPVCSNCHGILDPKRAKELDIQFAAK